MTSEQKALVTQLILLLDGKSDKELAELLIAALGNDLAWDLGNELYFTTPTTPYLKVKP